MAKINLFTFNSRMQEVRRLAVRLLLFFPIVIFIAAMNYFVDPAYLYKGSKYELGMVEILASGKNVANVTNFNERLVQKDLIKVRDLLPEILVIGSSRSMQIGTNIFPRNNIINNSVSGATLGDYLWILYNYEEKGSLPGKIILGVDPWVLNPNSGETRWLSFKTDADAMVKKVRRKGWHSYGLLMPDYLSNLFSLTYFQASVVALLDRKPESKYFATDDEISEFEILLRDGRRSYNKTYRSKTVKEVRADVKKVSFNEVGLYYYSLSKVDPDEGRVLEAVLAYLKSRGVEIVFFLPPYHPDIYTRFLGSEQRKVIVDIEDYYINLANKYDCKIIGSYNPKKCGLEENDFYDAIHPKKEAVEKMFR